MQLAVQKKYTTTSGFVAHILFVQPHDVVDEYPFVGFVVHDTAPAEKYGMNWSRDGRCGESTAFDILKELQ